MDITDKLQNLKGWQPMTVAELVNRLAGLPPMMDIYVRSGDTGMFLNGLYVELPPPQGQVQPPAFAWLVADVHPKVEIPQDMSYEEQLATQRHKAMSLEAVKQREARAFEHME